MVLRREDELKLYYNCIYLFPEMKRLLKYLFPVILAVAFWNCADDSVSEVSADGPVAASFSEVANDTSLSTSDSEFCLPRQVSAATSSTLQSSARKTNNAHRKNIEFTKSGKVINAGVRYFIQRNAIFIHSSHIEPSSRLLCLGRLII